MKRQQWYARGIRAMAATGAMLVSCTGTGSSESSAPRDVGPGIRHFEAALLPIGLVRALQDERAISLEVGDTTGDAGNRRSLDETRQLVDVEVAELRHKLDREIGEPAYADVVSELSRVAEVRLTVDDHAREVGLDIVRSDYTALIDSILASQSIAALSIDDPVLRSTAETAILALRQVELIDRLSSSRASSRPEDIAALASSLGSATQGCNDLTEAAGDSEFAREAGDACDQFLQSDFVAAATDRVSGFDVVLPESSASSELFYEVVDAVMDSI